MRRLLPALASLVALAVPAAALAHGGGHQPGYTSTVGGIDPPVPGLLVEVLGGDQLVSVRNWSGRAVVIEGADGRPRFRFANGLVDERHGSSWRTVKRGRSHAWHDTRIHWAGPTPTASAHVADWRIEGTADGRPFAIEGFIGYAAPAEAAPRSGGTSTALVVGAAAVGALALAALALPLVRRKGESEGVEPTG